MKILKYFLILFPFALLCTGCSTEKNPQSGYVSEDIILSDVINKMDDSKVYTTYTCSGTLNYFDLSDLEVPKSVNSTFDFVDSKQQYNVDSSSYYLNVPLHITKENWLIQDENGNYSSTKSTKLVLESCIYQPNGGYLDRVYYYLREDGGFYLKAFGVNKALQIVNPSEIECHGKWNVTIEYDKNGYLVAEKFETINSSWDEKSKSCYGSAAYTFKA